MRKKITSRLKRLPIRHQLALIALVATLVSTTGGFIAVLMNTTEVLRAKEAERLRHVARIVADFSLAPLAFADAEGAAERLAYLEAVPGVIAATVLDADGREFSRWTRTPSMVPGQRAGRIGPDSRIRLEFPLLAEGREVGRRLPMFAPSCSGR